MTTTASAPLFAAPTQPAGKNQYYELRYFKMRNGTQPQRTNDLFAKSWSGLSQRLGLGPVGFFNAVIGEEAPYLLMIAAYASLDEVEALHTRLLDDPDFRSAYEHYDEPGNPGFVRMENSLLKAFDGFPSWKIPAADRGHIFELRTYESNSPLTLRRKIAMFNEGEAGLFQRLGMKPVFFGETLVGRRMPSLTYMLAFDDLAARDRLWGVFGSDPEWAKMRSKPGWADGEIVSNISNAILRPTAFSQIR